jgi:hypothetical protein
VFTGVFDGTLVINSDEVEDWKYVNIDDLRAAISGCRTTPLYTLL